MRERLTIADVCRGIAEGTLPVQEQGHWYAIRKRDVVDYASRLWPEARWLNQAS